MEAQQLVAHNHHACAKISSGRVRCWGTNIDGELGSCEDAESSSLPLEFAGIEAAQHVATGRFGTCVVEGGTLSCSAQVRKLLGATGPGKIEGITNAVQVAVGDRHACSLFGDGRVFCFGHWDVDEALGPQAELVDEATDRGRGAGFIDLAQPRELTAGAVHNCVLEAQGRVMCWGQNTFGQLGDPSVGAQLDANRGAPRRVVGMPYIEAVRASDNTTCAVSDVGEVYCWGAGFGAKAMQVGFPTARTVAPGPGFVCVATTTGGVSCGGEQLGFAAPGQAAALPGFEQIEDVAAGQGFVCARRRDGMVLCQGSNDRGQLGGQHEGEASVLSPSKVLLGGVAI